MSISFTMPTEREKDYEGSKSSDLQLKLYRSLPDKINSKFTNELFIPLYQPDLWKIFNMSEDKRAKYGLVDENPIAPVNGQQTIYTFYFNIPIHNVNNYVRADGSQGYASVICPNKFNDYLVSGLGRRPLFKNPRCAYCEAAQEAWAEHNKSWAQVKQERGIDKKSLSKEGYKSMLANDPLLKSTYDRARSLGAQDRNMTMVFDHGKVTGSRPLDDNETNVAYQIWLTTPKTVLDLLKEMFQMSIKQNTPPFFDFNNPMGLQIMNVVKSVGSDKRQDTNYMVLPGPVFNYDQNFRAYLTNLASMPDPSDLLLIMDYNEMANYIRMQSESYNQRVNNAPAVNAPVSVPSAPAMSFSMPSNPTFVPAPIQAPVAPVLPQMPVAPVQPLVSPVVAPQPPVAQSVQQPSMVPVPSVPVAPMMPPSVPAMPPMPPSATTVPRVAPPPVAPSFGAGPTPTVPSVPLPNRNPPPSTDGDQSW